jgi:hypothetical protein
MANGLKTLKILAGEQFSDKITIPWGTDLGIAYIATADNVPLGSKLEMHIQSKVNPEVWYPLYSPANSANAAIEIVQGKIMPCSPYVDGRGAESIKFKINTTPSSDINLEVGLTYF